MWSLPVAPLAPSNYTVTDNSTSWVKLDPDDLGQHYFNLGIYRAIVGALCVISMVCTIYIFVIRLKPKTLDKKDRGEKIKLLKSAFRVGKSKDRKTTGEKIIGSKMGGKIKGPKDQGL